MNKESLIEDMYNCIDYADLDGFKECVESYLEICDLSTASQELATFLITQYTASKADAIAKLMEIIIQCNPEIALVNYPENHFFKIVMISGSVEFWDCFTEVAIEPHLEEATEEEYTAYYKKLLQLGAQLSRIFLDQYETVIKGEHYNGAFSNNDNDQLLFINKEDYEQIDDVVNKYNTMVGRRDVIKALMVKSGMEFQK